MARKFHKWETAQPNDKVEIEPYSETAWDQVSDWPEDCKEWVKSPGERHQLIPA